MINRKKNILSIIVILTIIVLILILIIVLARYNKYKELSNQFAGEQQKYIEVIDNPGKIINGKTPEILKIDNLFFTVDKCIEKYNGYIENKQKEAIYSLLNKEYIENNAISVDNVLDKIPQYEQMNNYITREVYVITGDKYSTFYAKTKLSEKDIYYIVNMDSASNAFEIIPIDSEIYNRKINETIESNQQYEDTVELNDYNKVTYIYLEEIDIVQKYFQDYLNNALFNPESSYNLLNEEYRTKKFGSLDEYKQYVEKNKEILSSMCKKVRRTSEEFEDYTKYEEYYAEVSRNGLDKYRIEETEGKERLICIDTYGNYYIFNIDSIMNYTLILDTYTIDLPEFTEKYNSATDEQKVAMNIDKFIKAINAKDYKYAYNCLADSFKNNYFKTQEEFENYAKQNFYENNSVEYKEFDTNGEYYTYSVTLTKKDTKEQKNKTFVMKLGEETKFEMSFDR